MRTVAMLVALAFAVACASKTGAPSASRTTTSTGSAGSAASSSGGTGGSGAPGRGGTATSTAGTTATTTPAPLRTSSGGRVTLAKACVHRGDPTDRQTLTVIAGPGETVTYSTYYSDYSTELNRPDYTTGHGYGRAGSDGRFQASWTVPAGATTGRATVRVTAEDMTEDAQEAAFIVVKQGERCP